MLLVPMRVWNKQKPDNLSETETAWTLLGTLEYF